MLEVLEELCYQRRICEVSWSADRGHPHHLQKLRVWQIGCSPGEGHSAECSRALSGMQLQEGRQQQRGIQVRLELADQENLIDDSTVIGCHDFSSLKLLEFSEEGKIFS